MPKIKDNMLTSLKRKRGELNISVLELSNQTNISRQTLDKILSGERTTVQKETLNKLNNWLYQFI